MPVKEIKQAPPTTQLWRENVRKSISPPTQPTSNSRLDSFPYGGIYIHTLYRSCVAKSTCTLLRVRQMCRIKRKCLIKKRLISRRIWYAWQHCQIRCWHAAESLTLVVADMDPTNDGRSFSASAMCPALSGTSSRPNWCRNFPDASCDTDRAANAFELEIGGCLFGLLQHIKNDGLRIIPTHVSS